ncbi:DUF4097 family beta strand repeat-containing protein [Shewanella sp. AS16]|uniref:DUF4097 family beta strand repeat-containing protein n=1 Tax=Shewanella sp. AS16 TaxID=2907625 RepID=UPI001F474C05|nr:DUF4097 family beta strand repeat-containing protein [Shewanella sp. AS16]MCE9685560.1 DUF4097 family beta strand repeat-containing protein [Shewanella sp. AS16]
MKSVQFPPQLGTLLFAGLLCFYGPAFAAQQVERQLSVQDSPKLSVKVQRGQVQILSWDKQEISVSGTLDEQSEGLVFEQQGNSITLEDKLPRNAQGHGKKGSALTIKVPRELNLTAEGVSADYRLSTLTGELNVALVSGNLSAERLDGHSRLRTVSGDIKSQALAGKSLLDTVSGEIIDDASTGEISYRLVSGDLDAKSDASHIDIEQVSGELRGQFPKIERLTLKSVSGDSQLSLPAEILSASLESVSGDLSLNFSGQTNLSFVIDGGPGGKIVNELSQDKPVKKKYSPRAELKFQTGKGRGEMHVSTISGLVKLGSH